MILKYFKGVIFDLDGVLVDTAKYHYLAWKRLAGELGFEFTEQDNERLKGVSRMRSLEILLSVGGLSFSEEKKRELAAQKNKWYVESLQNLSKNELLPGAEEFLRMCRSEGKKIALGSASKNAPFIIEKLGIADLFDSVIDGTKVSKAKPDPEIFAVAAKSLNLPPDSCVVFEDSLAGIQAAHSAGCKAIGIGKSENLPGADGYAASLAELIIKATDG